MPVDRTVLSDILWGTTLSFDWTLLLFMLRAMDYFSCLPCCFMSLLYHEKIKCQYNLVKKINYLIHMQIHENSQTQCAR